MVTQEALQKVLKRFKRMYDAKVEIGSIILLIFVRKLKVKLLVEELLKRQDRDVKTIKKNYVEIIKISAKILKQIDHLQHLEPLLKREFVFDSVRYDDCKGYMYHQIKKIRVKVLAVEDCVETDYVLLPTGLIGHINQDPSIVPPDEDD